MSDWEALLFVGVMAAIPICLKVADSIKNSRQIRKANSEWDKTHNVIGLNRKRCLDCKYCVSRIDHPFQSSKYYWALASRYPSYCKKLKQPLRYSAELRCQAKYHAQTMYEDSADI